MLAVNSFLLKLPLFPQRNSRLLNNISDMLFSNLESEFLGAKARLLRSLTLTIRLPSRSINLSINLIQPSIRKIILHALENSNCPSCRRQQRDRKLAFPV